MRWSASLARLSESIKLYQNRADIERGRPHEELVSPGRAAMKENKLVIFDYDGVIVDSLDHNLAVAGRAATRVGHGRLPTRQDVDRVENMSFEDVARHIGLPEEKLSEYSQCIYEELAGNSDPLRLFPGMAQLIRGLSQRHALVLVTANARKAAEAFLGSAGLLECFRLILGTESPGSKADKLRDAAEMFGVVRHQVYMVGDSVSDIRQAKMAGVKSVAVTWGYHSEDKLARESPDFVVRAPAQIAELLRG